MSSTDGVQLAALGAILLSLGDAGKKRLTQKFSPLFVAAATYTIAALSAVVWFLIVGIPEIHWLVFLKSLFACAVVGGACELLFLFGIRGTEFSLAMPLLAFIPVFSLLFGYLFFGELPTTLGLIGVLLVVSGGYLLALRGESSSNFATPIQLLTSHKGCQKILGAAALAALVFSLQQPGAEASSPEFFYAMYLVALTPTFLFFTSRSKAFPQTILSKDLLFLVAVSLCWMLALGCVFVAHTLSLKTYSSAVLQLQTLLSVVVGRFIFRESDFQHRIIGSGIMVVGVVLIILGT